MTSPAHDPQAAAAAFLAGDLSPSGREEFQAHLLECEPCWVEVRSARDGRALAENLRESAPQAAREYLRALGAGGPPAGAQPADAESADTSRWGPVRARSRLSLVAALIAGAVLTGGLLLGPLRTGADAEQARLAAAASLYLGPELAVQRSGTPPVSHLGSLSWRGSTAQSLAGQPVTVHYYTDAGGRQILLVSSLREFPRAEDAQSVVGASWTAALGGAVLFCVDHGGLSWLVIADSRDRAIQAGRQAGLA